MQRGYRVQILNKTLGEIYCMSQQINMFPQKKKKKPTDESINPRVVNGKIFRIVEMNLCNMNLMSICLFD